MSKFLETYGVALFVLVLMAILIAFAGPLGMKIKNATTDKVSQTEEIGNDEVYTATTGRPKPPKTAVDKVYCIYYDDGEMTISQNEIEPEAGRTVVSKGFYTRPSSCTTQMITARVEGAVMPKSCFEWFYYCENLTEIKNIQNLYTNECTNMYEMFSRCRQLTSIDVSHFDTGNVTDMSAMFSYCSSLINVDVSGFNTTACTHMTDMFRGLNMKSLDISNFDLSNVSSTYEMFGYIQNLDVLVLGDLKFSDKTNEFRMFETNLNADGVHRIQKVYSSQKVKDKFCTDSSSSSTSTWWQSRGVNDWIVQ